MRVAHARGHDALLGQNVCSNAGLRCGLHARRRNAVLPALAALPPLFDSGKKRPPPREIDVAVVGAGPAGLAVATALLRVNEGLRIEVYERLPYRKGGSGVLLTGNGLAALEAIDPELHRRMLEASVPLARSTTFDAITGELLREVAPQSGCRTPRLVGWYEVRDVLLHLLEESLPDAVRFVQPVMGYEDRGDDVRAEFMDAGRPVAAKLLVGADGWFSYTRFQCLADGPPPFSGRLLWRARVPWREGLPRDEARWYVEAGGDRMCAVMATSNGDVVFQASASVASLRRVGLDYESQAPPASSSHGSSAFQEKPKERCLAVFDGFCRAVTDLMDFTDPELITEQPLHARDGSVGAWGRGRVSLVGDAAHASLPNGQGCNLAFEDALALARSVQQHGLNETALRSFEAAQAPRVAAVLQRSQEAGMPAAVLDNEVCNIGFKSLLPASVKL